MAQRVRLVTFDALFTLIKPRRPIHVQYAEVFDRYVNLGRSRKLVDPDEVNKSFKIALREVQKERPVYSRRLVDSEVERRETVREERKRAEDWWGEVIWRTGIGAGLDARELDQSLGEIVSGLMKRFSSKEGYEAVEDAIATLHRLRERNVYIGVITNSDARMRDVLKDLEFPEELFRDSVEDGEEKDLVVISEEEGAEKPDERIFEIALRRINMRYGGEIRGEESLHVGDELESDFEGAVRAGWRGLLVGRDVKRLSEIVDYVDRNN